jgi:DNA helicase MCM8
MPLAPAAAGPPSDLWQLYFPVPTILGEPAQTDDDDHPTRITLYECLRRWVPTSAVFAVLRPEDALAQDFALNANFSHLQQGEGAPFRRSEPLTGPYSCHEVLDALALAVHVQLLEVCTPPPDPRHLRARLRSRRLHIRVFSMSPLTPIRSLKADKIGCLVSVRGSVIRVAPLRPFVTSMTFSCPRCLTTSTFPLSDGRCALARPPKPRRADCALRCPALCSPPGPRGRYEQPPGCPANGCRAKQLVPDRRYSATRDWQKVKIQEAPGGSSEYEPDSSSYGRVPRQMDVELSEGLIDCCVPGDVLEVRLMTPACLFDGAEGLTPLCCR